MTQPSSSLKFQYKSSYRLQQELEFANGNAYPIFTLYQDINTIEDDDVKLPIENPYNKKNQKSVE